MGVDVFFFCFVSPSDWFLILLEKGDQRTTGNVMENQEDYFEWL